MKVTLHCDYEFSVLIAVMCKHEKLFKSENTAILVCL